LNSLVKKHPILVAGGGIGGFATALCLARQGYSVQLFEQAHEIKEIGAGIQIGPNAFHVFERLGLVEKVTTKASMPESLVMMDGITAEEVVSIPLQGQFRERFQYPYALIHRADLHHIFVDACAAEPNIEVVTATRVENFTQEGDLVTLHTERGDYTGAALIAPMACGPLFARKSLAMDLRAFPVTLLTVLCCQSQMSLKSYAATP